MKNPPNESNPFTAESESIISDNGGIAVSKFNEHIVALQQMIEATRDMLPDHMDNELRSEGWGSWRSCAGLFIEHDERLEKMTEALEAIAVGYSRICDLIGGVDEKVYKDNETKLRKFTITVTEGMLRNHMLTLTAAKQRGLVSEGEQFVLTPKHGETVTTALVQPGNRLQARRVIGQFYERFGIKPGDQVVMKERAPGVWDLNNSALDEAITKELLDF